MYKVVWSEQIPLAGVMPFAPVPSALEMRVQSKHMERGWGRTALAKLWEQRRVAACEGNRCARIARHRMERARDTHARARG